MTGLVRLPGEEHRRATVVVAVAAGSSAWSPRWSFHTTACFEARYSPRYSPPHRRHYWWTPAKRVLSGVDVIRSRGHRRPCVGGQGVTDRRWPPRGSCGCAAGGPSVQAGACQRDCEPAESKRSPIGSVHTMHSAEPDGTTAVSEPFEGLSEYRGELAQPFQLSDRTRSPVRGKALRSPTVPRR